MKYVMVGEKLIIRCSQGTCPRTKRYVVQEYDKNTFPEGTVVIKMKCPWHQDGDFDEEWYYDKDGDRLYWEPVEDRI